MIIALDLTRTDQSLYRLAGYFTDLFNTRKVYFLHIVPENIFYKGNTDLIHQVLAPAADARGKLKERLTREVSRWFKTRLMPEVFVEVIEGDPLRALVGKTETADADLLLLGKKKAGAGSGITARMIARKVMSSVFFLPETTAPPFRHIVVPVDFSEYSFCALQTALALAGNEGKVTWLYVADLAPREEYLPPDTSCLESGWKEKIITAFNNLLSKKNIPGERLTPALLTNIKCNTACHIMEWATENEADLIVMGAKGQSDIKDLLFGSVTERLVTLEEDIPVLIVR